MHQKKRRGFTLIELVIVVAIIGILTLMIMPQYNDITNQARLHAFENNCHTVIESIALYQSQNDGMLPSDTDALAPYLNGGWEHLEHDRSASYSYDGSVFTASFTDNLGTVHSFAYPD